MRERKYKHEAALTKVKSLLDTIQFGSITLIIQDSKVIQIDKNEKIRLK